MRAEEKFDIYFLQQFFFGCILYHYPHLSFVFVIFPLCLVIFKPCRLNCVPHKDM